MTYTFNKRRRSRKTSTKRKTNRSVIVRKSRSVRTRRRRSIKTSRRRRSVKNHKPNFKFDLKYEPLENKVKKYKLKFKEPIYEPLIIYTKEGCPACVKVQKMCNEKGIKFKIFNRVDYEDKVNKNSNNYRYVPAIFDSRGIFIGGTPELEKLIT